MFAREKILNIMADGSPYKLGYVSEQASITKPYTFILLRQLVSEEVAEKLRRGVYRLTNPDKDARSQRLKGEIQTDIENVMSDLMAVQERLNRL